MKVAIIGGGLAGLACASRLSEAKHLVEVYDKGRSPGGRLSTRSLPTRLGDVSFDLGAQYFRARDPSFRAEVDVWFRAGFVSPWASAGSEAWVGVPTMSAMALALAADLQVRTSARVVSLRPDGRRWCLEGDGFEAGPFDAVVVALPAEQARALVAPIDGRLVVAADVASEPCWTVLAAFDHRLPIEADVIRQTGILDWAARNSAKPRRSGPEAWVMHATAAWSKHNLESSDDDIGPHLLAALATAAEISLPEPALLKAHRWRFARSGRFGPFGDLER